MPTAHCRQGALASAAKPARIGKRCHRISPTEDYNSTSTCRSTAAQGFLCVWPREQHLSLEFTGLRILLGLILEAGMGSFSQARRSQRPDEQRAGSREPATSSCQRRRFYATTVQILEVLTAKFPYASRFRMLDRILLEVAQLPDRSVEHARR